MKKDPTETRNLMLALLFCAIIFGVWQYVYELPRKRLQAEHFRQEAKIEKAGRDPEK